MNTADAAHEPLFSNRFLTRLVVAVGVLVALTLAISLYGRTFGAALALGDHTDDTSPVHAIVGEDVLGISANAVRFEAQRRSGRLERLDLALTWPGLDGYSRDLAARFNAPGAEGRLVFVQYSQSVMTRDMSGRVAPIYSHLFDGAAEPGPAGLTLHRLDAAAGFSGDVLLTGTLPDGKAYAVRCRLADAESTNADCQRDVAIGNDLSMLYRFSRQLLPHWADIERELVAYTEARLQK